ncbi:MAG: LysM peptidoglycan-binding domain-containing protein [Chloroflexota bacterium]
MRSLPSPFSNGTKTCHLFFTVTLIFVLISIALPESVQAEDYHTSSRGTYHIVRSGDTLRDIALAYGTTTYALAQINGIHDINRIEVGQHIYISGHGTYHQPQNYQSHYHKPQSPARNCISYHVVHQGENLTKIARRYHLDPYYLAKANHIYNLNHVYTGQKLCIPTRRQSQKPQHKPTHQPAHYAPTATPLPIPTLTPTPYIAPTSHSQYAPGNPPHNYNPWAHEQGVHSHGAHNHEMQHQGYHYHPHYQGKYQGHPHKESYHHPIVIHPTPTSVPPTPAPYKPIHNGWTGLYYAHAQCGGTPLYTRHDAEINFDWGHGGPGGGLWNDNFSIAWTTDAYFYAGDYRFHAHVDDGIRVYVDNHLLIGSWREQSATQHNGDIWLSEGYHHVRVEYFEQSGLASVKVHWSKL